MLVIVRLTVLAAAEGSACWAMLGRATRWPIFRVRISPHGFDRHVVPLRDRGRRGGVARPSFTPTRIHPTEFHPSSIDL